MRRTVILYFFLYRFGGAEFPPIIMFKIFIHSGGQGVKYYCGKKAIKPASEVCDAPVYQQNTVQPPFKKPPSIYWPVIKVLK